MLVLILMFFYEFNHRQSVSSMSGPLQVVPDIDDQINNPEHLQEVRSACLYSSAQNSVRRLVPV